MRIQNLILLGAGHAHLQILKSLARERRADTDVTLISPFATQVYSGMVPGHVAGHYDLQSCSIALAPLVQAAGVRHVTAMCIALDAAQRSITVRDAAGGGRELPYQLLSIDTGGVLDRERIEQDMPGARANAVFVRPMEQFVKLLPPLLQLAQTRPLSLAVVGAGAAGVELALALAHRLPTCHVTLVTGGDEPAAAYPPGVQRRVAAVLRARNITVLREACTGIERDHLCLTNGATLACDAPILAIGSQAPGWLRASTLALDDTGFISVNAFQQSTSHPDVFAAGDVATRLDAPHARSGVYAVRAAPVLEHNLRAILAGTPLKPWMPPRRALNLLSCGNCEAIASWGTFSAQGGWAWRWKDMLDRGFMRKLQP